jgi:predicted nucleic acid-binding Zn ribbon protein
VAGEPMAEHCQPVSLRDERLLVRVDDPVWATEVRYAESRLLERLAELAGAGQVVGIDVRVSPPDLRRQHG